VSIEDGIIQNVQDVNARQAAAGVTGPGLFDDSQNRPAVGDRLQSEF
jgi:hypothetical protein